MESLHIESTCNINIDADTESSNIQYFFVERLSDDDDDYIIVKENYIGQSLQLPLTSEIDCDSNIPWINNYKDCNYNENYDNINTCANNSSVIKQFQRRDNESPTVCTNHSGSLNKSEVARNYDNMLLPEVKYPQESLRNSLANKSYLKNHNFIASELFLIAYRYAIFSILGSQVEYSNHFKNDDHTYTEISKNKNHQYGFKIHHDLWETLDVVKSRCNNITSDLLNISNDLLAQAISLFQKAASITTYSSVGPGVDNRTFDLCLTLSNWTQKQLKLEPGKRFYDLAPLFMDISLPSLNSRRNISLRDPVACGFLPKVSIYMENYFPREANHLPIDFHLESDIHCRNLVSSLLSLNHYSPNNGRVFVSDSIDPINVKSGMRFDELDSYRSNVAYISQYATKEWKHWRTNELNVPAGLLESVNKESLVSCQKAKTPISIGTAIFQHAVLELRNAACNLVFGRHIDALNTLYCCDLLFDLLSNQVEEGSEECYRICQLLRPVMRSLHDIGSSMSSSFTH